MKIIAMLVVFFLCFVATTGCMRANTSPETGTTTLTTAGPATTLSKPSTTSAAPSVFLTELSALPKDYPPDVAAANGDYVNVHGQIHNAEKLTAFLDAIDAEKAAVLRIVQYTTEGDPIISDIVFDHGQFTVWYDDTRDAFGSGLMITQNTYKHKIEYVRDGATYVFLTSETEITDDSFDNEVNRFLLLIR